MSNKICSVDGCESKVLAKELCSKHYSRMYKHGDISIIKKKKKNYRICKVDSCNRLTAGKDNKYCRMHNERFVKTGDPNKTNKRVRELCSIEKCKKLSHVRGLCSMHAHRLERHGDISIVNKEFHGLTNTPEYRTLTDMKSRCYNSKVRNYNRYGGRGITVCDRWLHSYSDFIKDMGKKPFPGAQIDRIDNDGNYEPSNCRWVTRTENARNKSTTKLTLKDATEIKHLYNNGEMKVCDIASIYGVDPCTITDIGKRRGWKDA